MKKILAFIGENILEIILILSFAVFTYGVYLDFGQAKALMVSGGILMLLCLYVDRQSSDKFGG